MQHNDGLYPQTRENVLDEICNTENLIVKFREDQKCVTDLQELLNELIQSLHKLEKETINE